MNARRGLPIALLATSLFFQSSNLGAAERPNLLYIMADDNGRQAIGAYGGPLISTPNIDRLAREGVRFTQAMAGNSICSPSRAMLLTGQYNHLCGVRRLDERFDGAQQTFPKRLQKAGYRTAIVGKWHLFTEPTGFDYYCVAPGNGGRYTDPLLKETGPPWGNGNAGGKVHAGYMTDVITDVALEWLKRRDAGKPFCLMIHHKAPHAPHIPAPRHQDMFRDTIFPEPPTLLDNYAGRAPEPVADGLAWSRLTQQCEPQYRPIRDRFTGDVAHDTRLMFQEYLRNYLRLVVALDENVGRVLDHLDRTGLATNTVVIYTSDNGYFLGEHGFYNKMWMYDEGFSIPMLVRAPGGRAGVTDDRLVSILDIAPTLLDLAGANIKNRSPLHSLPTPFDFGEVRCASFLEKKRILRSSSLQTVEDGFDYRRRKARPIHLLVRARYDRCPEADLRTVGMSPARSPSTSGCPRDDAGAKKGAPRIGNANAILSRLGGALIRNSRELPRPQTILRGLRRIRDIGLGYRIGKESCNCSGARPRRAGT